MEEKEMHYLLTAEEMRRLDRYTIEEVGLPAAVLMERAALAVAERVRGYCEEHPGAGRTVLVVCGMGNNGGDGLAVARLLSVDGFTVEVWTVGEESRASEEWCRQKRILEKFPVSFCSKPGKREYTIVIDAVFGVGLSREPAGIHAEALDCINGLGGRKIAVDLPSGVNADTGAVYASCVQADETVTFGCRKRGLVLYPGCEKAGRVIVADIGIVRQWPFPDAPAMYALDEEPKKLLPGRKPSGNKGTFGKVLLIAGSVNMAGAAILSARAAYRSGAGMVKVISPQENRVILQTAVPEALYGTWEELESGLEWADVIAFGSGIGRSKENGELLLQVLRGKRCPLLIDGDGLNLLADDSGLWKLLQQEAASGREIVLTPHVGELARLLGKKIPEIKQQVWEYGGRLAMELQAVVVAKDARSYICKAKAPICVTLSGNSGLATAGSGDVLAGMIAGFMAQGMESLSAACTGSYLHGRLGDRVSAEYGKHACMAGDLTAGKEWRFT